MTDRAVHLPFADEARKILGDDLFGYMIGLARDNGTGLDLNESEFLRYALVPRLLTGKTGCDITTTMFGRALSSPIAAGAFAGDRVFHEDGLLPIARACRALALPMIVSEETITPLTEICAEHDMAWLQLRAAGPLDRIRRLMDEASRAGAAAMVLTILAPVHPVAGLQPGGYSIGAEIARRGLATIGSSALGVESLPAFPAWSWVELAEVAAHARSLGLPLLVKGVLHADDVSLADEAGCSGIVTSNIGMRQSSRWVPALRQLPALRARTGNVVVHDGGVRYGSDVVTAMALGADLAIVVRPLITALVAGGETAVSEVLKRLIDETVAMATWCGAATVADLRSVTVEREGRIK